MDMKFITLFYFSGQNFNKLLLINDVSDYKNKKKKYFYLEHNSFFEFMLKKGC